MNTLSIMIRKEFVQMNRDFRVFWLPIVFILLGLTQPIVTYYLPTILESLGGTQGITIDPSMAVQYGGEVLASTLGSQYDQLGLIIIVISTMSIIQADKANGMLAFILSRPVTVRSYIGGKVLSNYLIVALSIVIGYFVSYIYVNYLFTSVSISNMVIGLLFYLVWTLFIVSFTTMISAIFHSQGIIALISIVFLLGCRIIVGLSPVIDILNPAIMSKYATEVLMTGTVISSMIGNVLVASVWIFLTLFVTNYWIANKKFNLE